MWMKLLLLFGFWNIDKKFVFGLENLALNKPTRQTSEYGSGLISSNAVDGNLRNDDYSCSHTKNRTDTPNWLLVDLEAEYEITSIKVLNRREHNGDRLNNFTVSVWQYDPGPHIKYNMVDNENCICVHYPNTAERGTWTNLTCTKICMGRFVLFILNYQEILSICELEIFGNIYNGCSTQYLPEMNIKKVEGKRSSSPNCTLLPYEVVNVYECIHQCLQMNNCISFNYGPNLINTVNCQLVRCFSHPKQDFTVDSDWIWRYLSH
ncbi:hypothetical protein LOTGIDRAFT_162966 [Lottia gigantea]|uniref:Fucolectin tachylectin-4 pentraxin-1 domain-containing protein n=1 Tax=Lottia gigantea TaxID=225164 RepID=V4A5J6_LOTGI|nr:hypothetical protein LOTGIDRAFT_162966 [Lottia gigantea]ESO91962.1 hypothetical protein LOTGIDRAFT_162966 [Lottia gigantea]